MTKVEKLIKELQDEVRGLFIGNLILKKSVGKKNNRKNRKLKDIRMKNTVMETLYKSYAERGLRPTNAKLRDGVLYYKLNILMDAPAKEITVNFSLGPSEQES